MTYSKILVSLLIVSLPFSVQANDEYDYINTPSAKQIADLQDNDSDGVINARDKCPHTMIGAEVNNDGCSTNVKEAREFQLKVLFENDSSTISPVFIHEIENMSAFLAMYPETTIELQGYASRVGKSDYNLTLSKQRAIQVEQRLIDSGIRHSRIKIVGYGDTVLVDEDDTELSHALNRRVVATVVGYDSKILEEWTIFSRKKR